MRLNYQVAASQTPSGSTTIPEEGQDDLRRAGIYWERYVKATDGEPDPGLARIALIVYDKSGLNQPGKAKEAVRVLAADSNDTQTYLLLVQYATAAGDTRTAQLAAQKAVDLAPKKRPQAGREGGEATANSRPRAAVTLHLAYPVVLQHCMRCDVRNQGEE